MYYTMCVLCPYRMERACAHLYITRICVLDIRLIIIPTCNKFLYYIGTSVRINVGNNYNDNIIK